MMIRDRIKELRRVKAAELRPHPDNWRVHPKNQQDALRGLLAEVGYADALLAREMPDGSLQLIDGHLRAETTPEAEVPVLIVDLDDRETAKLLALHDPLAGLAETNHDVLAGLLAEVETENRAVQELLEATLRQSQSELLNARGVELRSLDTRQPPRMTWVLIGIPTVRFGEIAETIDSWAAGEGICVETTSNDGSQD
jgi:hypothetical protein